MKKKRSGSKKGFTLKELKWLLPKLVLSLFLLSVVWVLLYRWVAPPVTLHMVQRRAEGGGSR